MTKTMDKCGMNESSREMLERRLKTFFFLPKCKTIVSKEVITMTSRDSVIEIHKRWPECPGHCHVNRVKGAFLCIPCARCCAKGFNKRDHVKSSLTWGHHEGSVMRISHPRLSKLSKVAHLWSVRSGRIWLLILSYWTCSHSDSLCVSCFCCLEMIFCLPGTPPSPLIACVYVLGYHHLRILSW